MFGSGSLGSASLATLLRRKSTWLPRYAKIAVKRMAKPAHLGTNVHIAINFT
jgi:hypothetical protein